MRARPFPMGSVVAVGFALAVGTADARADEVPSVDVRTFRPSIDPNAGLVTEPATTQGAGVPNFAAFLHTSARPVTITDGRRTFRQNTVWGLDTVASVGLGDRWAVGVVMPIVFASGRSSTATAAREGGVPGIGDVTGSAVGDLALHGKATLRSNDDGGVGLAALGSFTLPTGTPRSFVSEGSATATARLLADLDMLVGRATATLGFKARGDFETFTTSRGTATLGHEIPWSLGLVLRPRVFGFDAADRHAWELGVRGALPAGPTAPFGLGPGDARSISPVILSVADRVGLGRFREVAVLVGFDVGFESAIGSPLVRSTIGVTWAPKDHDRDGDGIEDDVDLCPPIAEDKDGFEDDDGCPEIDDDDDGIVDRVDACPRVPGEATSDPATNGCPAERSR
ncbi:MAG: hypothetical protein U0169_03185 [Polyangiaceae bacterium]